MDPRELLEANLAVIDRAVARVCRDASVRGADAEDFASSVRLALLERDCAILRKYEGRSSFATFITIVIRRLLVDQRRRDGRWYASAAAQRQGQAAVLLERLLIRDRRSLPEAATIVGAEHPDLSPEQIEALASILPERAPRLRLVAIKEGDDERVAGPQRADDIVIDLDARQRAGQANRSVRSAIDNMESQDRVLLRMRFARGMAIADIARALGVPQRPLYRRLESLLTTLRRALHDAGLGASDAATFEGSNIESLDFGFGSGKSDESYPSSESEDDHSGGPR